MLPLCRGHCYVFICFWGYDLILHWLSSFTSMRKRSVAKYWRVNSRGTRSRFHEVNLSLRSSLRPLLSISCAIESRLSQLRVFRWECEDRSNVVAQLSGQTCCWQLDGASSWQLLLAQLALAATPYNMYYCLKTLRIKVPLIWAAQLELALPKIWKTMANSRGK